MAAALSARTTANFARIMRVVLPAFHSTSIIMELAKNAWRNAQAANPQENVSNATITLFFPLTPPRARRAPARRECSATTWVRILPPAPRANRIVWNARVTHVPSVKQAITSRTKLVFLAVATAPPARVAAPIVQAVLMGTICINHIGHQLISVIAALIYVKPAHTTGIAPPAIQATTFKKISFIAMHAQINVANALTIKLAPPAVTPTHLLAVNASAMGQKTA